MSKGDKPSRKRGRKAKNLVIDGNWQGAVKKALKKERPEEGWPQETLK
jgi:hypothetical protein